MKPKFDGAQFGRLPEDRHWDEISSKSAGKFGQNEKFLHLALGGRNWIDGGCKIFHLDPTRSGAESLKGHATDLFPNFPQSVAHLRLCSSSYQHYASRKKIFFSVLFLCVQHQHTKAGRHLCLSTEGDVRNWRNFCSFQLQISGMCRRQRATCPQAVPRTDWWLMARAFSYSEACWSTASTRTSCMSFRWVLKRGWEM